MALRKSITYTRAPLHTQLAADEQIFHAADLCGLTSVPLLREKGLSPSTL